MKAYRSKTGLVAPMDRPNVDTDIIIPKQFLKSIKRTGFGPNAFDGLRYLDRGEPGMDNSKRPLNPEFALNFPRYRNASILVARENFGCGSSREHAPWALSEMGFMTIIAPSFADIFYNNCFKNGMLPIVLTEQEVEKLFRDLYAEEGYKLTINLEQESVCDPSGNTYSFAIDPFRKKCLLEGLDDIGLTLSESEKILAFEERRKELAPWVYKVI